MEFGGTERFQVVRQLAPGGWESSTRPSTASTRPGSRFKTLRTWSADSFLRFKAEFRALQDLHHPNLVSLGELLEERGVWFFTMELIHGAPFLTWVCTRTWPEPEDPSSAVSAGITSVSEADESNLATAEMRPGIGRLVAATVPSFPVADDARLRGALGQLAQGLCVLHRAHKIHRDIKPANVLITPDGQVKSSTSAW